MRTAAFALMAGLAFATPSQSGVIGFDILINGADAGDAFFDDALVGPFTDVKLVDSVFSFSVDGATFSQADANATSSDRFVFDATGLNILGIQGNGGTASIQDTTTGIAIIFAGSSYFTQSNVRLSSGSISYAPQPSAIPLPAPILLLISALAGLAALARPTPRRRAPGALSQA